MHFLGFGFWLAVSTAVAGSSQPAPSPPKPLDSRLVFERVAAEPDIVTPTGIAVDNRARVLVIECHTHFPPEGYTGPPADRIRVFEDRDGDGKLECTGTFFEGTKMTMNLAVARDGSVFVAARSAIYRLEDRDGDGRADGLAGGKLPAPIVRLDTRGDYPHNGLSGFAFETPGVVYFGLGENLGADYRLIGRDGTTLSGGGEGGNIYRCRPDGNGLERVATGFWNPFHMAFDAFGRIFAVDNDPDSRPPCRLLHIVDGGDYGYRFRNGRRGLHPFTAWNGELPGTLGMVAGTGEAPSGVIAYESANLPDEYRGTLLVTSWGDHRIERYRPEPHGASFRAVMKPVVVGGEDFRPVGIALAPDGSVYISDWVDKSYTLHGKGRIWRLKAAQVRMRGESASRDSRPADDRDPRQKASRLATLVATGDFTRDTITALLRDDSADVRALAARVLPAVKIDLKTIAASDASPLVRSEAMRRLADPAAKDIFLQALESDDPFVQQAARRGLRHSLRLDELIALAGRKVLSPARRLGLLLILRDSGRADARELMSSFLADRDPSIRFAAIQWVGEHRLKDFRPQLLAGLASSAATRDLFAATLAALEQLDGTVRGPKDEVAGEDYIVALLNDRTTSAPVRERGLRMLRPDHPALTLDVLRHFVTGQDETLAIEAVRTLCQSFISARFDVLAKLAENRKASLSLRAEAILGLADDAVKRRGLLVATAKDGQPVLRREALRSLRGVTLTEQENGAIRASSRGDDASLELLGLLEVVTATSKHGVSEPKTTRGKPPAADLDLWLARLEGPADPSAGERVFFHPKGPGCYRCHQIDGRGGRAGPDLSILSAGTDRRRLVESIAAPSKEIAPQFVAWSVARTDATVFSGILLEQTPESVLVFADAQGKLIAVKREEIAERKPQSISIMPDNLAESMTIHEFRDLVAFLYARR
jgi:putative membrane-bound dehydrogenase-like protein